MEHRSWRKTSRSRQLWLQALGVFHALSFAIVLMLRFLAGSVKRTLRR